MEPLKRVINITGHSFSFHHKLRGFCQCPSVCVCVRACVRACVRVCVRALVPCAGRALGPGRAGPLHNFAGRAGPGPTYCGPGPGLG